MGSVLFLALALISLAAWLYLAAFHGLFWMPLRDAPFAAAPKNWPSVRIVVPARNEALSLPHTLPHLLRQDYAGDWKILLVDDHSTDNTSQIAMDLAQKSGAESRLTVIQAPDLPHGWVGKVAALQAGVAQAGDADFFLFTDADIAHPRNSLSRLASRAVADKLDAVSLMVRLHVGSLAEKLLIPAFVFFFAMLYPFRRINDPLSRVAGAAGGVFLVRRAALENAGGLVQIKSALIDDCALGRLLKDRGGDGATAGRLRLTLTDDVRSLRPYPEFRDVLGMISRTAFTQLRHSEALLVGSLLGLALLFAPPFLTLFATDFFTSLALFAAFAVMTAIYAPLVAFYGLPLYWALTLPFAALLYMKATLDSARHYWQGRGGQWKGRTQAT